MQLIELWWTVTTVHGPLYRLPLSVTIVVQCPLCYWLSVSETQLQQTLTCVRACKFHINWRPLRGFSPTNWQHIYQPATSPVCKILYFVAHLGLVGHALEFLGCIGLELIFGGISPVDMIFKKYVCMCVWVFRVICTKKTMPSIFKPHSNTPVRRLHWVQITTHMHSDLVYHMYVCYIITRGPSSG